MAGVGYALMEELMFDKKVRIANPKLRDYCIPTAVDVPPENLFA